MVLKFKQRGKTDLKKVLIYGEDGSGKSTFAENYCRENNLNPVVIDIDDTNYTNLPILEIDLGNDIKAYRNIKTAIDEIAHTDDFDTIILDGVTSMLELFVSKAKGIKKYGDRAERFADILKSLLNSNKNLIFIGQIDMKVIHNEDFQSPKPIVKINSIVNEKYLCIKNEKGVFTHEVLKFRTCENATDTTSKVEPKNDVVPGDTFVTAGEIGEPKPEDDPLRSQCYLIKEMLEEEGKVVTKQSMKVKVVQLSKETDLPNKNALLDYIAKHCPEEL